MRKEKVGSRHLYNNITGSKYHGIKEDTHGHNIQDTLTSKLYRLAL